MSRVKVKKLSKSKVQNLCFSTTAKYLFFIPPLIKSNMHRLKKVKCLKTEDNSVSLLLIDLINLIIELRMAIVTIKAQSDVVEAHTLQELFQTSATTD